MVAAVGDCGLSVIRRTPVSLVIGICPVKRVVGAPTGQSVGGESEQLMAERTE